MSPEKELYWEKLKEFNQWRSAIVAGIASDAEQEYVELQQWLRTNFQADYVDLF